MDMSRKEDLEIRLGRARGDVEYAAKTLNDLNFQYAAGFVKKTQRMAIVVARVARRLGLLVVSLRAIETELAELEVPD